MQRRRAGMKGSSKEWSLMQRTSLTPGEAILNQEWRLSWHSSPISPSRFKSSKKSESDFRQRSTMQAQHSFVDVCFTDRWCGGDSEVWRAREAATRTRIWEENDIVEEQASGREDKRQSTNKESQTIDKAFGILYPLKHQGICKTNSQCHGPHF